jgi:polysaccharide export outer membrane protein
MNRRFAIALFAGFGVTSLFGGQVAAQTDTAPPQINDYKLGAGDKVRILVYNEPNLSGEFSVNAAGSVAVPLIGDVTALGRTTSEMRKEIEERLANGYLRAPQVSIDVLTFRPFFILGEVSKPGDYPYSAGLSAIRAVATAGGYTYRADKRNVYIKRVGESEEKKYRMEADIPIHPGDTIRIGERYF